MNFHPSHGNKWHPFYSNSDDLLLFVPHSDEGHNTRRTLSLAPLPNHSSEICAMCGDCCLLCPFNNLEEMMNEAPWRQNDPETSHYPIGHDSDAHLASARVTLSVSLPRSPNPGPSTHPEAGCHLSISLLKVFTHACIGDIFATCLWWCHPTTLHERSSVVPSMWVSRDGGSPPIKRLHHLVSWFHPLNIDKGFPPPLLLNDSTRECD